MLTGEERSNTFDEIEDINGMGSWVGHQLGSKKGRVEDTTTTAATRNGGFGDLSRLS